MLCFGLDLLTVVCADVFCIPDVYVIIVILIFYFFLELALIDLCPLVSSHLWQINIVVVVRLDQRSTFRV